jgi:hypothetical protein
MSRTVRVLWFAALAPVLAGCYPRYISDIGESPDYPLLAAGFERGQVITHTPGSRDVSIYYRFCEVEEGEVIEVVAILRNKRATGRQGSVQAALEAEKATLLGMDPELVPLGQETVTLRKNGREYAALKASFLGLGSSWCFEPMRIFAPSVPRYIELIIWRHQDRLLILRSSTKPEHPDIASAKNLELLEAVNWTVLPF